MDENNRITITVCGDGGCGTSTLMHALRNRHASYGAGPRADMENRKKLNYAAAGEE